MAASTSGARSSMCRRTRIWRRIPSFLLAREPRCVTRPDLALADSGLSTDTSTSLTGFCTPSAGIGTASWHRHDRVLPIADSRCGRCSERDRGPCRDPGDGQRTDAHGGLMAKTLIRIFLDTVAQHPKPALFMRRLPDTAGHGRWESLS